MTGSELAFLAMGLGLGVAAGAIVLVLIRRRAAPTREVRITVTPGAIPRRQPSTLADLGQTDAETPWAAARGGPGDQGEVSPAAPPIAATPIPAGRTPVLPGADGTAAQPAFRLAEPVVRAPVAAVPPQSIAVSGGIDPMLAALRASAAASAEQAMAALEASAVAVGATPAAGVSSGSSVSIGSAGSAGSAGSTDDGSARSSGTVAMSAGRGSRRAGGGSAPSTPGSSAATTDAGPAAGGSDPGSPGDAGPCDGARRIAEERCTLAERARAQATSAEDAHRAAQRAYDEHETASSEASEAADARAVRRAKDDAQARFRAGRASAVTTEQVEAAARAWLEEINRINTTARDGAAALTRERARGQQLALALETTSLAAEAARIAAETAEAACLAAREALAECEEQRTTEATGSFPAVPSGAPLARGGAGPDDGGDDDPLAGALGAGGSPRIFRLIQGDRSAMHEIVTALADGDPAERRRWQLALADLVDAVLADALAASALEFPPDHAFWGLFTPSQARDIAAALSSLGYRFDGLGGWSDERVPSQRDLSLALGYAGLDPMRMRHWPTEQEMTELYADVRVSAAEHLAGAAGDLTLGELVTMLGRRADGLADIWNEWGRIRPLLLAEA